MYRVFNFIAVRVMIDKYAQRMNQMSHVSRFAAKAVNELANQFTIGIERKNHD